MSNENWSDIASPVASEPDDWSDVASPVGAATAKKQNKGILGDIGTGLKRGVEQMPGMVTGIADIAAAPVSAITGINRPFSRAADYVGEKTGFQPAKWAEQAAQEYSPETQQSLKAVEQADGFTGTLKAIGENPRSAVNLIAESLPSTLAGGILARGAMGAVVGAEKLAAMKAAGDTAGLMKAGAVAGGIGEGAVTAGQQMSQTDYNVDPLRAAGAATAAGIGTGIIGGISGRVANKLGLADIEGSIAAGTLGAGKKAGMGAYAGRIAGGAVQEGALEELPQSAQEQVWQNLANGKPWNEGVGKASAQGLVAGMAMGAGVNALPGSSGKQEAAPPIVPPARDSINLITDPAPLQGRIDSLLGIGDKPMSDAQRAQYAKDLEASFGEVVGYAAGADGLEVPVTMEDYLRSTLSAADMTRDKPLAAGANDQSANRLNQLADEEATQQPDIAPGYVPPVIPVVGPLSAIANAAVQSGAHQTAVMQQAATEQAKAKPAGPLSDAANQSSQEVANENESFVQRDAGSVQRIAAGGGAENIGLGQQNDVQNSGIAPVKQSASKVAPNTASAFDVSGKNLLQLKHLAAKGQPGWKEAATAELARRNSATAEQSSAIANEQQAGAGLPAPTAGDSRSAPAANQEPVKNASPTAATVPAETVAPDAEAIKKQGLPVPEDYKGHLIYQSEMAGGKFMVRKKVGGELVGRGFVTAEEARATVDAASQPKTDAAPSAATVSDETAAPSQEPIKNEDDWLGALFGAAPTAAESASKEVQTNRQAQDKADRVDSAIAMLTGEIEASNAAAAEVAARNYKSNRKQIELKGDGPGKNGSLSISAINESRKRRTVEALQNASSSIKQAIEFIAENPDAAFKQVADMEAAVTKQFNEGFFGPSAKLDGQLDMAVGSLIGSGSYSGEGSAGRKLRMAAHAYASADAVSQPKTGDTEKSVTGPLRITENADMGQFTARTATGESMGSFQIKDGKVANIKARAQWAMDDVRAAAEEYAKRQSQPKTDASPKAAQDKAPVSNRFERKWPLSVAEAEAQGIIVSGHDANRNATRWGVGDNWSSSDGNFATAGEALDHYYQVTKPNDEASAGQQAESARSDALAEFKGKKAWPVFKDIEAGTIDYVDPSNGEIVTMTISAYRQQVFKLEEQFGTPSKSIGSMEDLRAVSAEIKQAKPTGAELLKARIESDKAKASDTDTRFSKNTIFTADKVAAAKARMKAKLGTMNSGIDPELLIDGMTVAGAYIESGVRKFADYAKAMVEDLGDGVKPYLLSFYEAARAYPGLNKMGMDTAESAASQHQALLTPEVKEAAKEVIGEAPKVEKKKPASLGESLKLKQDWGVKNIDGYTRSKTGKNQETDAGLKGGIKDEFLSDATRYLKAVAKLLEEKGFTAQLDSKGNPAKTVSTNEGGPAVGGDAMLMMRNGKFGIYADVGVTNIRGSGPSHPQGVSLMVRVTNDADKNKYGESNNWLATDLSAGDLSAWFDKQYQAFAKRSAEVKPAAPAKVSYDLSKADDKFKVATEIADFLIGGGEFKTIIEARKKISEMIGRPIEAATELAKQADETIETAVVLAGRDIVKAGRKQGRSSEVIYDRLVDLYRRQPNLAVRSSTSVRDQAYSTPVPLAFLASELAGITYDTKVLEPTAGNGMLLIGTSIGNAVANELNHDRAGVLRSIGFNPTERNAATEQLRHAGYPVDAVIANPPFGATKDANGDTIIYDIKPGFKTREVDHAIVFKSLESMKDDGRAVLIVGGVQSEAEDARREDYRGSNKRSFYYNLYNEYNVIDHFTVDGGLYSKQGASYPVDIIVIDGRGKSSRDLPAANLPVIFKSYDSLKEKLNGNGRVESEPVVGANGTDSSNGKAGNSDSPAVVGSAVGSSGKDGNGSAAGVSSAGVQNDGHSDNGQPSGGGAVSGGGKPKSANASGSVDGVGVSDANRNSEAGSKTGNRGNGSADLGGVSVVNGERVESGLTDRRGKEQETGHQVAYTPHSNAASVGTLVPRAMKDSIAASLQKISDEVGSIDDYVAESLAMDLEDVKVNFSAEQIDALALAIRNAEAGKGFIIGDQTGIGKGRVVAAMIRYALVTGKTPIFVTEKPNLYSDMIRDLDDIGMTAELALDTKNPKVLITNGGESIPYTLLRTENGEVVENNLLLRAPKSGKALDQIMQGMMDGDSLGEYKVIFTTYSQLQTVKGATTTRQKFIQRFGEGNYMVFDESHNAGGSGPNERARGKNKDDTRYGGESTTNATGRSAFVRNLVQKAFGTFFSSATYAKRPDVMDLYSSTNMKLSVDRISELGDAIKSGGVPMQQVVANMLTKDGQYIRRERTFAGVSYDTQETKVDKATAENMASAMRSILAFSRAKESVLKEMQKEMDREGGMLREMGGEKSSVQGANFGSIMHNLIDQMLLSLKVQDSVSHAIERLKAGEKVVLTVSNTMGSFLKDYSEELGLSAGDPVSMSFADLYDRYLEKQRMVTIKDGGGNKRQHRLTDAELGPRLVDMFNAVRKQIESSGFGSAPISPIDYMHNELRKAGYKTDEITGRTIALNYSSGTPLLASRTANIRQRVKAVSGFNNGETDVLILNQAGSTGLSLHASSKFKDKRKRHMIIVQAEKNIDTHMQMLGRVHRTGQVVAPAYSQMMADIPAEMRPASVLMKKMASLNANTTASRTSSVTAEGVVDFMNNYGGQVVHEYLRDNPDVLEAVGGNKVISLADDPAEAGEDDIRKFTGYIPILPIKQQEEVYRELVDRYNELIERENSLGTNKLEAKAVDLDAETISSQTVTEDRGDPSVFASPANMEKVDVKRTVKPYSSEEVAAMVSESLDGKTANQVAATQLADLFDKATAYGKEKVAKMVADEVDPVKLDSQKAQLQLVLSHARTVLNTYKIGDSISVKDQIGQFVYGVITKIERSGRTANPAAGSAWKMHVALANGDAKSITLSFSQIGSKYELRAENRVEWYNTDTQSVERIPVSDIFDKGAKVRREKRWIVTGNILAGFARFPGQIITYTKNDGTTAQGVLMSRQFDFEKEQKNAPVRIKDGKAAIKFFTNGGQGGIIGTPDRFLMIAPRRGEFEITVPSSKKDGGTYYLDTGLTNIVGDFYKRGSIMSASVYTTGDVERVVNYLVKDREETIIALSNVEKAKELLEAKPVALLSIAGREKFDPISLDTAAGVVARMRQTIKEVWKVDLRLVPTFSALPQEVKDAIAKYGEDTRAKGVLHKGSVYIVADEHASDADVETTILHEIKGHVGLRRLYSDAINKGLGALYMSIGGRRGLADLAKARGFTDELQGYAESLSNSDFTDEERTRIVMEELLSHIAQDPKFGDKVKAIVGKIRAWLRDNGFMALAKFGEADLLNILAKASKALETVRDDNGPVVLMTAWHGSPHDHNKFDSSKIGTGEGAQAYGHGLYFAGERSVAEYYRNAGSSAARLALDALNRSGGIAKEAIKELKKWDGGRNQSDFLDAISLLKTGNQNGRLYQVELAPSENEYLDWDKPLSEQSELVRDALIAAYTNASTPKNMARRFVDDEKGRTGEDFYREMQNRRFADEFGEGSAKSASDYLHSIGIRGIRYLDGSSRSKPLKEIKAEFLAELPEDAEFDEVMDLVGTGRFSPKNEALIKALAADEWLGFDYPAQAISTALGNGLSNYDASPELMKAVSSAKDGGTHNFVIFNDADVSITAKYNIASKDKLTPADKAIYGMAAEGKSAAEVLKFIASASRSPFNRQVAKLLLKTGIAPSITVGDGKNWKISDAKSGEAFAAAYDPKTDTVALFRPASAERNALHELIHAASLKALAKNGLASAQMKALFAHVEKTGKLTGMYGIRNVDEFIAEAFSNPKFQAALKQVSAAPVGGKPSSEWDWFIRVVRGILGLKQGADNALSQALDIGVGVMRENMALQSGDGVIRFNHALRSTPEGNRPLNAIRLANLRRIAAGLERPKDAVFLRVTEDGKAITTGPKGARIPETFLRFAETNGLDFEARRNGEGRKSDGHTIGEHITSKTEAMPTEYRESGALYFGEGNEFFDRTGKTRYSLSGQPKNGNVRGMADKDTVAGTQAPTSAGDGSMGSATIPSPEIPRKLSQKQFEGILQDIDGYGPIEADDPYRTQEFRSIIKRLKTAGIDYIDMYHVTDAGIQDFNIDGIRSSSVDYIGRAGENARASSVYGFLDPDDIEKSYDGILGAESETPNVIHIKVPVENIGDFRWDSNFNLTYGAYSGIRFVGNIPSKWISGAYPYNFQNEPSASAGSDAIRYAQGDKRTKQTDSEAFRKWFGDSKVVDANGEPLVVYHGTASDITAFDIGRSGESTGNTGFYGAGAYFSEDADYASGFSFWARRSDDQAPNVVPVYLSLKNPAYINITPRSQAASEKSRATAEKIISTMIARGTDQAVVDKLQGFVSENKFEPFMGTLYNALGGGTGTTALLKEAGFDGVTIYGGISGKEKLAEAVAFDPTQIKSAIGNYGDFDGSNPDIRYNVADEGKIVGDSGRQYDQGQRQFFKNVGRDVSPKGLIERTKDYLQNDFWKKMAVGIVDQFRGLRDLNDNGQAYMLARLSKGTAGAFETLLRHGKLSIKDGVYDGDQSGGFIEKLGVPLQGELDDFLWWVAANRAEGLAKNERENLFTPADIAAGKSLASGETAFDYTIQTGLGKGRTTRSRSVMFADAQRVFNEFQKNSLDIAEQSGLIDGAARKFWESEFYVPFYRVSEEDGEFIGAKMGQSLVRQQAFKKLKGGTDKLNSDLLSNTLLNWSHLIEASAKNRAAKAALVGAENVGAAQRVAGTMAEYAASNGAMLPPGTKQTVWFQENGQKVEYLVTDPFVMTAITSLEYAGLRSPMWNVLTTFKHWLTIGVTASPAFKVRNLIRDSIQAIGTSDLGYNPITNIKEGFKASARDKQEYVSALASGGLIRFGTMLEGSESSRVRQLIKSGVKDSSILDSEPKWRQFYDKFLEPGISAYNELGNRSEEITRAALYNQLIKQGKSHAEAALMARDLMDFSMQGSFVGIRILTQIVPFMNARLQGMYKLGRSAKDNPRKLAIVTGAVAMASIALMLGYEDDDDWKRREDWDRDNFWWFKFGGIEYRIPKPFEVGAVGTLAERSVEYLINDEMTGERFRKVASDLVLHNLSMNPIPQAFKPIVDLYANKDSFTGRPIETMSMQRLDPTMRYNSNTSLVARGLSTATGGLASPVQYDHMARAYFDWLGAFVIGGADMIARPMTNEPEKPERDYWKFATQGILKEQGSGNSRYLTMVYDQAHELEQAHATHRQMIKEGKIDDAREYAEDNAEKLKRYRMVEQVKRTEAKFNENIRAIERGDLDPEEKKLRIERIQQMKENVAKRIAPGIQ